MIPRPSLHANTPGATEGGLARMMTAINEIRARRARQDPADTGDTIQGSAEALFTRGQALVGVLNGSASRLHARQLGLGLWRRPRSSCLQAPRPRHPGTHSPRHYFDGGPCGSHRQPCAAPITIREVDGVKIGIIGFTTDRGPQVVGRGVTPGRAVHQRRCGAQGSFPCCEAQAVRRRHDLGAKLITISGSPSRHPAST
jgi:hypothetical protein